MRTYDPIKKDDRYHFQMIHTLIHRSHNFAFGECLPYRPMRWLWTQLHCTNVMESCWSRTFDHNGIMEKDLNWCDEKVPRRYLSNKRKLLSHFPVIESSIPMQNWKNSKDHNFFCFPTNYQNFLLSHGRCCAIKINMHS